MKISGNCLSLVKLFEGCKLDAYQDIVGKWTIGYGATGPGIISGLSWSQAQADNDLNNRLDILGDKIYSSVPNDLNAEYTQNDLTQGQLDAMTSFAYNEGFHALQTSSLFKYFLSGNVSAAADQFPLWDRAGGVEVGGLERRREAEKALFLS